MAKSRRSMFGLNFFGDSRTPKSEDAQAPDTGSAVDNLLGKPLSRRGVVAAAASAPLALSGQAETSIVSAAVNSASDATLIAAIPHAAMDISQGFFSNIFTFSTFKSCLLDKLDKPVYTVRDPVSKLNYLLDSLKNETHFFLKEKPVALNKELAKYNLHISVNDIAKIVDIGEALEDVLEKIENLEENASDLFKAELTNLKKASSALHEKISVIMGDSYVYYFDTLKEAKLDGPEGKKLFEAALAHESDSLEPFRKATTDRYIEEIVKQQRAVLAMPASPEKKAKIIGSSLKKLADMNDFDSFETNLLADYRRLLPPDLSGQLVELVDQPELKEIIKPGSSLPYAHTLKNTLYDIEWKEREEIKRVADKEKGAPKGRA